MYDRPKVIPSKTLDIKTNCGTLHMTMGYDKPEGKLIEIRLVIGKNGVCGGVLLHNVAFLLSRWLQSPDPRYKIKELIERNMIGTSCSQGISCLDVLARRVVDAL